MWLWLGVAWVALGVTIYKGIKQQYFLPCRHRHNDDCQDWCSK